LKVIIFYYIFFINNQYFYIFINFYVIYFIFNFFFFLKKKKKKKKKKYLLVGINEIDVDDWENNTNYEGYEKTDITVVNFWKVIINKNFLFIK